ncbi:type II secretion system protein GspG [Haloferula sp.]|uniref:type II secretion system protein GspG n=1 Tax=Haloferula sp. TaxID=2497595 RepID=UPI003C7102E3
MKRVAIEIFVVLGLAGVIVFGAISTGVVTSSQGTVHSGILSDFNTLSAALRMYEVNVGRFPRTEEGLAVLVNEPATLAEGDRWVKLMDRIPVDPWQNEYRYMHLSENEDGSPFELCSAGPDGVFGNEDDLSSLCD